MTYLNVVSAVVRALAAETINSAGGCDFEPKVQCAKQKGEIVGKEAAFLTECWVFGRLHSCLEPRHWIVLNACYSTHMASKVGAIGRIVSHVTSPAPRLFLTKAVTAWAYPQLGGAERVASVKVSLDVDDNAPAWRKTAVAKAQKSINAKLKQRQEAPCEGVIILPAHNYDMNTWDLDGTPERTRRDWRRKIFNGLNKMVDDALLEAGMILTEEGVFFGDQDAA
ncbi:hypothetical protein AABC73_14935 [Pseudomonas sp. G.S.17]|uniref:hypothetical protein n=1 Tax=Pseudomonas sp. G.S.17 TaxID=3137451 RepID=UPI00311CD57A